MDDEDEEAEDSEESRLLPSPSLVVLSTLRKETDERFIVGRWCDAGQCDGIMTDASSSSVVAALGVEGSTSSMAMLFVVEGCSWAYCCCCCCCHC